MSDNLYIGYVDRKWPLIRSPASTRQKFRKVQVHNHDSIDRHRDSEAGEIDKGGEGTPWLKKKELKKGKEGDKKSGDSKGEKKKKKKKEQGKLMKP